MLAALFIAYLCGLLIAPYLAPENVPFALPFFLALFWFPLRRHRVAPPLLVLFMTVCGILLYHLHLSPVNERAALDPLFTQDEVRLRGEVVEAVPREEDGMRIDIELLTTASSGSIPGRARLYVRKGFESILAGEEIQVLTRLRPPRNFGLPGEFDMERYLARRQIVAVGHIDSPRDIARLITPPSFTSRLSRFRQEMATTIDNVTPERAAPLVKALLLGQKEAIPREQRQTLAAAGISHLFAISGLHFTTLSLLLYLLLNSLYTRFEAAMLFLPARRLLPLLMLPLLLLYLLFTGAALSAQRALLMLGIALLLFTLRRRTAPFTLLTGAAFLLLLLDPLAFYEPSLQLSLAGVAGLLALLPRCMPYLPEQRFLRYAALLFCTTGAATLATLPLSLHHFHLVAPAGLLLNLVCVPLVAMLALPLGLAGILIAPFWPAAAALALAGCGTLLSALLSLAETTLRLPLLTEHHLFPTLTDQIALFALVAALLAAAAGLKKPIAALPLLLIILYLIPLSRANPPLIVTALSVGQGDATLLHLGSKHFLIDTGGFRSGNFDSGERLIIPALARLGIRKLDGVILSHDHPDHAGGLPYLLAHFPIGHFYAARPPERLANDLGTLLKQRGIGNTILPQGWSVTEQAGGVTLAFFVPDQNHPNANECSVVVYAGDTKGGVLLTGDLGTPGITQLLATDAPGPVSLLKIPHHGSRFSPTDQLLERFSPQQTFVSAGFGNTFSLPHPSIVDTVTAAGAPLWRTDLQGSLEFSLEECNWLTRQWNKSLFR